MKLTFAFLPLFFLSIILPGKVLAQNAVGIGTEAPNPKAVLELIAVSGNQGFLAPRLTTAQRTSFGSTLTAADNGMFVFDSGEGKFYVWFDSAWHAIGATELTAGEGISVDGMQITNTGDTDAEDDITVTTVSAGDITGTFENLFVAGLGGRPLDTVTEPATGFTLVWDGAEWKLQLPGASEQTVAPNANLLATNTQAALEELQVEILSIVDEDDQTAAEVAYTDNHSTGQTNVQGAIDYLLTTGDGDNDAANEIQNLSISGNDVNISGGTGFTLSPTAPASGQVLKWNGTAWDVGTDEGLSTITSAEITDGSVTTADIADNSITSDDISDQTIEDIDISLSAAISGGKIVPDFGSQPISTIGTMSVGGAVDLGASGVATIINGPLEVSEQTVFIGGIQAASGFDISGGSLGVGTTFSVEEGTGDIRINDDFHLFHFDDGVSVAGELISENLHADNNVLRYTKTGPGSLIFMAGGEVQLLTASNQAAGTDALAATSISSGLTVRNTGDTWIKGALELSNVQGTPEAGMIRYDAGTFEGFDGSIWSSFTGLNLPFATVINDGTSNPLYIENIGSGGVAEFNLNNTGAFANALTVRSNSDETFARALSVQHTGLGGGLEVEATNVLHSQPALLSKTAGLSYAGRFEVNNASNTAPALQGWVSSGAGPAINGNTHGEGPAGTFKLDNVANGSVALAVESNGINSTALFQSLNSGTSAATVEIVNNGTGHGLVIQSGGTTRFGADANFPGLVSIGHFAPSVSLDIDATDAIRVPAGTSAERPASQAGMLRFNTVEGRMEYSDGVNWWFTTPKVDLLRDARGSGTGGQALAATTFNLRELNGVIGDNFTSLASNVFTLQPGVYIIEASVPASAGAGLNQARLVSSPSTPVVVVSGTSANAATNGSGSVSVIYHRITIASPTDFGIQHWVASASAGGTAVGSGEDNIYTTVQITKLR